MARLQDVLVRDTRAAQPAATAVPIGELYCVSDEGNIVEQSDGAAWVPFSPTSVSSGVLAWVAADPGAPSDGDLWFKYTGGVLSVNIRDAGATKSAPIAVI